MISLLSETGQVLVGYDAVAQEEHNPKNTVYDAKRFIGKVFTRKEISEAQKQYAFRVSFLIMSIKIKCPCNVQRRFQMKKKK